MEYMMKRLTLIKFDCDFIYSTTGVLMKLNAMVFIRRFEITEFDVEDANESHQTIDTDRVDDEDICTE